MESLYKIDDAQAEREKVYKDVFNLLSFEKVTFNGRFDKVGEHRFPFYKNR